MATSETIGKRRLPHLTNPAPTQRLRPCAVLSRFQRSAYKSSYERGITDEFLKVSVLMLAVLFASPTFAQPVDRFNVRFYQTATFASEFQCCPMPTTSPITKKVAFAVNVNESGTTPLLEGEILFVIGELLARQQNTTGMDGAIAIGAGIYLGTTPSYVAAEDMDDFEITEHNGENLDREAGLVDETRVKVGSYLVPANVPNDRKYVNLEANTRSTNLLNEAWILNGGSRLSVIRFTPIELPSPHHGWEAINPHAATNVENQTVGDNPTIIYELDLDDPNGDGNQDDAVGLQISDVIAVLGECEATYTDTVPLYVHSKVVLVDSADSDELLITRPNAFSMKAGVRGIASPVKAGAYEITSLPGNNAHWKYLRLIGSLSNLTDGPSGKTIQITPSEDQCDPPCVAPQGGKLSLVRFRYAQMGIQPSGVERYDQTEYNATVSGASPYDPMELICKISANSTSSNFNSAFKQTPASLSSDEWVIATSELQATDQDGVIKNLGSQLAFVDSTGAVVQNISKPNQTEMDQNMHHLVFPKVGVQNVPSGLSNATIRRTAWSTAGFDGNCNQGQGTCTCCTCPPLVLPGQTIGCNPTMQTMDVSCDVVGPGKGRLTVLRFKPLSGCFADCFPNPASTPAGTPDGTVNIDDLLNVIFEWGMGSESFANVNDDGTVNIDDLLAVITGWGPCDPLEPPEDFPATLWACYNQHCAGLEGQAFQDCYTRCAQAVCAQNPEECE